MRKKIKTEGMVRTIAMTIEEELRTALGIFSDGPDIANRSHGCDNFFWYEIFVYNTNSGYLTYPEVEVVQKVMKGYMEEYYTSCINYSVDIYPVWRESDEEFLNYPAIKVTISKSIA